jgi:NarL family two-component system sensor histidine kinase LiaS
MKFPIPRKLRGLLGKLLLAYLLITAASAVTSGLIMGFYEYFLLRGEFSAERVSVETIEKAGQASRFFGADSPSPNTDALKLWLVLSKQETENRRREIAPDIYTVYEKYDARDFSMVVDRSGAVVAASGEGDLNEKNFQTDKRLRPIDSTLIKTVLAGASDSRAIAQPDGDLRIAAAAPITDKAGNLRGALLIDKKLPFGWGGAILFLTINWVTDFFFLFFIFIYTGTLFSFFVGRHLIKRLDRIGAAANAWSVGDFSARAIDKSTDEIGLLTQRLNSMAIQLGDFFELRQNLAAVEERNRLARELHDSVKQQVFSLSMQIGAANRVLSAESSNGKSEGFASRLHEAEKLANQVQHELQDLINELRPASEEGESLNLRLKALAADWSRQHSIAAETRLEKVPPLSPTSEHAIFRIAQEALANVARHSGASKVTLEMEMIAPTKLQISVSDNGKGFENSSRQTGLGLKTMRERAESLPRGWFEINSISGGGTRVVAGCGAEKN